MKTKVLHVGLDTHLGGIETYLLKITTNIDRERYQFDFLMFDGVKPCYYDELSALGCHFHSITSRRKNPVQNYSELKALLLREKYDIVHCHQNSLSYITPILLAQHCGCGVIVHSHNAGLLSSISAGIRHKINYYRLPRSGIVCAAVSDIAGEWMFGKKRPVTVLNNGLDTSAYCFNEVWRKEIRDEFGLEDREIILHTGAFRTQKNHDFLIDIFKAYHDKHPESVLMLVGEGKLKQGIVDKVNTLGISSSVIFTGLRSDVPKILSAADKYLFPSFYEGFPNALIEAETAGLYCVVADTITKQAKIDEICAYVSLDAGVDKWVELLEGSVVSDRVKYASSVEQIGLGIESEIDRLHKLYMQTLDKLR